jgi:hypothetical protein
MAPHQANGGNYVKIKVVKLVGKEIFDRACSFTVGKSVSPNMAKFYLSEHSPIRTQLFWIEMLDIPTFVSVHFVRHKIGVEHFCKSNREDRPGYTGDSGRNHPMNHAMLINAQALINMARKRLCGKAHAKTRTVMGMIAAQVGMEDYELMSAMVPECQYRGRCLEMKPCKEQP